jgi:hypothetical protein
MIIGESVTTINITQAKIEVLFVDLSLSEGSSA